jgi:pimeloyl-ACP methyl ester carboxylesterase
VTTDLTTLGVESVTESVAIAPPFEIKNWTWRGYSIRYAVKGSGQPLILIHGFGAAIGHWRQNIPALAAAGYQVFALDLLGFGGSDKPAWTCGKNCSKIFV